MVVTGGPDIATTLHSHGAAKAITEIEEFVEAVREILSDDTLQASMQEPSRELATEFTLEYARRRTARNVPFMNYND